MRKLLLSSKSFVSEEKEKKNQQRRTATGPKRTVGSNWTTRNDSSNISALLHPENPPIFLNRQEVLHQSPNGNATVTKKCCLTANTCYCRERRIKPKLITRPRKCLVLDEIERSGDGANSLNKLYRSSLRRCLCTDEGEETGESKGSFKMLHNSNASNLSLTDQRRKYDDFRRGEELQFLKDLVQLDEQEDEAYRSDKSYSDGSSMSGQSARLCIKDRVSCSDSGYIEHPEESKDHFDIDKMKNFRDDHYFETHSASEMDNDIPEHTCIHQFELDDKLLPNPTSVDVYGRSRCSICSKPMDGDKIELSRSCFSDSISRSSLKNFSKGYELGLVPRSINIGDKTKIQLKVNKDDMKKFQLYVGRCKKPEYFNTLALRQQRMTYF